MVVANGCWGLVVFGGLVVPSQLDPVDFDVKNFLSGLLVEDVWCVGRRHLMFQATSSGRANMDVYALDVPHVLVAPLLWR